MADLIQLDYAKAVEDFDEEMVNLSMSIFIDETYEELKKKLPEAYAKSDYQEIKAIAHKFKTTAKYMGAYDFSELCDQIQKCVEEEKEDLIQLKDLYSIFMRNLDGLYAVCLRKNKIIQNQDQDQDQSDKFEDNELKNLEEDLKEYDDQENDSDHFKDNDNDDNLASKICYKKSSDDLNLNDFCKTPKGYRKYTHSFPNVIFSLSPASKKVVQKNKIQLRYEQAIHKFEADIVNVIIQTFVTEEYKVMKENLKKAFESKDIKELQSCLHTMKLKAKYICAEEFAEDCINIENCIKEQQEDYSKLTELFPAFMEDFDLLYTEVKLCYNKINSPIDITPKPLSIINHPPSRTRNSQNRLPSYHQQCMKRSKKNIHHKTFSHCIKLRGFDELKNKSIITSVKKSAFYIDLSSIQTNGNDANNTFEEDIIPLFHQFKEAIKKNHFDDLIDCLNSLRDNVIKYKYTKLISHIDAWKSKLMNDQDDNSLSILYEDIEELLNHMISLMKEKEAKAVQTPEYQSIKISRSNTPKSCTAVKSDECLFQELQPLSLCCFFKENLTIDEFEKQIKLFSSKEKREKADFLKNLPKPLKNMNPFIDCNYPFKEEGFSCIVV